MAEGLDYLRPILSCRMLPAIWRGWRWRGRRSAQYLNIILKNQLFTI